MSLSEQEIIRRESLTKMNELGIDAYPAAMFDVSHKSTDITEHFKEGDEENFTGVSLAGRIMLKRIMGKASFVEMQDGHGRIQLYINRDLICPDEDKTLYNTVFKKLLDIGDYIGVKGNAFLTQKGEISVRVESLTILSKSLRPLPVVREKDGEVFDGFSNPENRYRMRYVDLVVNPSVRDTFIARNKIIQSMRTTMSDAGYLEVETPVLQPVYGGANARPFTTHHNTLDMQLFLRISNELYLKKLIVGGFDGVFEFAKDFRNEGMDRSHNPEFTVMEIYCAFKDYFWMMEFTEKMIEKAVLAIHGTTKVTYGENEIDFAAPWPRLTMYEAIEKYAGVDISDMDVDTMRKTANDMGVHADETMGKGKIID